jgi:MHS family proline/betaine transporter-like MFS transporter
MSNATPVKSTTYAEATEAEKHAVLRKVTGSSFLGNFIEWFDYASYSYLATVIALVFFPDDDHTVAVMMTFGVFALSFLVRLAQSFGATWATRRAASGHCRCLSCS